MALSISDLDRALEHGTRALQLAQGCGASGLERVCLVNLSNLFFMLGNFNEALRYSERALNVTFPASDPHDAEIDNLARIRLAQGRADDCEALLDEIAQNVESPSNQLRYVYRYSLLTRLNLLAFREEWAEALDLIATIARRGAQAGDRGLVQRAQLSHVEANVRLNRERDALTSFNNDVLPLAQSPFHLYSDYEGLLASWLASIGRTDEGRSHFERARRVCQSLRNAPAIAELDRKWQAATLPPAAPPSPIGSNDPQGHGPAVQAALQSVAALMLFAERPHLAGQELLHLLIQADCAARAALVATTPEGRTTDIASLPASAQRASPSSTLRLPLGESAGHRLDLHIDCRPDPQAIATVGALGVIINSLQRLEKARLREEVDAALWPIGDSPSDEGAEAVASGRMAELMAVARRAGMADLCILITGESGTGKEVLARQVHAHSTRAGRTFLPFNCSTVPRDMLDSQLFGHRRGAFTGADRDFPGMIRSADSGTLFLDEIAELGTDLQPKLLRFLESGEICPLGESKPFVVDVRVIAATNANLERAVEDGRFREDLFYRLNVIRLRIPPLRERREEIPSLVQQFVEHACRRARKRNVRIADETLEHLVLYRWPGNIRQLQNEVRRMVALADSDSVLLPADLGEGIVRQQAPPPPGSPPPVPAGPLKPALETVERDMIQAALRTHRGDLEAAARSLGISRKGLYLKRHRFGL